MLVSVVLKLFVILVKKQSLINCHIQFPLVFLPKLCNLFSLMYGVRPPLLLADTPTMLASLMIIVNSLGFTSLRNALMFFQVFQNFKALVERQFDSQILAIQSDWGGEYEKLDSFFQTLGISHHVSCPQIGRAHV